MSGVFSLALAVHLPRLGVLEPVPAADERAEVFGVAWIRAHEHLLQPHALERRRPLQPIHARHRIVALGDDAARVHGVELRVFRQVHRDGRLGRDAEDALGALADEGAVALLGHLHLRPRVALTREELRVLGAGLAQGHIQLRHAHGHQGEEAERQRLTRLEPIARREVDGAHGEHGQARGEKPRPPTSPPTSHHDGPVEEHERAGGQPGPQGVLAAQRQQEAQEGDHIPA